jgi:hypothetical protein
MTEPRGVPKPGDAAASRKPAIRINYDRARQHRYSVTLGRKQGIERKYNIKLSRQDYQIIKLISDHEGRSASYFVSTLIYHHIFNELANMAGDSEDALLLIAAAADAAAEYNIMATPWLYDVMSEYIDEIAAKVTGTREADLTPLMELISKHEKNKSYLHEVAKLMLEI